MKIESISRGWKFYRDATSVDELKTAQSIAVNLPHTWNNLDGQDGGADYYRGVCYYSKEVDLNKQDDRAYYLEMRGVNSIATVYVNGEEIGRHEGGYSTFRLDVTACVRFGINEIVIAVDNRANDYVYPETADFTFYGGIYRDVYFIEASTSRFDLDYYGGEGVMVTPRVMDDGTANVNVTSYLTNPKAEQTLVVDIMYEGKNIISKTTSALEPSVDFVIDNPMLWNGRQSPNIYKARVRLVEGDIELDTRVIEFGIRSFAVDKDGFYLNGKKYDLHGVSRHQDRENKGWAISRADHDEDMELIKELGATSIRLAHYQHDQYFYDLCDRAGMVVWAEIPYISVHMHNGRENALNQMRELIVQCYNHPSIMFWGISNEITLGGESEELYEVHRELDRLVKSLDSTRLTTIANVTMCDTHSPIVGISDIMAYNHYFGWYVGDVMDNAKWIDDFRAEFPSKPLAISEYGAEAVLSWHSSTPRQGDYTEEYQCYYHENMLKIFRDRPYLWATYVWNMFDFGVDSRDEGGVKGRNNKGLVTYDRRTKKDSFYLYKAYWSSEPFVHICSKRYARRAEKETIIKVYTNSPRVDLYVGGKLYESQEGDKVFEFKVPLSLFGTSIKAVTDSAEDTAKFRRVLKPCQGYILKSKASRVHNWFEKDGVRYEFKYIEDKFSIRDKINDILANSEGEKVLWSFLNEAFGKMTNSSGDRDKTIKNMLRLVGSMSVERVAGMAQDKMSEEMLYRLNEELNKISK